MDKTSKKALYELLTINKAFQTELNLMGTDGEFSRYHSQNAEWYRTIGDKINSILNFQGQTEEELISYMSSLEISSEQRREFHNIRKLPMFKKAMGENALQQRQQLEAILGTEISNQGATIASEHKAIVSNKSENLLEKELNDNSEKLDYLLTHGEITQEQYDGAIQSLDYIYDYFISQSKGQQIPFRKISDIQYEDIERQALENGIDFNEQLQNITENMMYDHEEVQEVAQEIEHKTR